MSCSNSTEQWFDEDFFCLQNEMNAFKFSLIAIVESNPGLSR